MASAVLPAAVGPVTTTTGPLPAGPVALVARCGPISPGGRSLIARQRRPKRRSISATSRETATGRPWGQVGAHGIRSSSLQDGSRCSPGSRWSPKRRALWQASVAKMRSAAAQQPRLRAGRGAAQVGVLQLVGEIAHEARGVAPREQGRDRPHHHRLLAEGLDVEAQRRRAPRVLEQGRQGQGLDLHALGHEQTAGSRPRDRAIRPAAARRGPARGRRAGRRAAAPACPRRADSSPAADRRRAGSRTRRDRSPIRSWRASSARAVRQLALARQDPVARPRAPRARARRRRVRCRARGRVRARAVSCTVARARGALPRQPAALRTWLRARRRAPADGWRAGRRSAPPTSPGARSRRSSPGGP